MATGRIGSTPTLRVRWSDQPTTGTTVLSGLDDNSVALVYDAGYEAVYRNGVLLSRGNDYTATDGTTVTLIDATLDGDIIEIFANDLVPLTDAISKGQYNAKGALLSATAASTPGVLPVGTNGQVLTAASGESTGLQWATPAAGAYTSLATGTLSGATTTISAISGAYEDLYLVIVNPSVSVDAAQVAVRINSDTTSNRHKTFPYDAITATATFDGTRWPLTDGMDNTVAQGIITMRLYDYANATTWKIGEWRSVVNDDSTTTSVSKSTGFGVYNQIGAVTSLQFFDPDGGNLDGGDYVLYGVK
jgi:hypothetical protein